MRYQISNLRINPKDNSNLYEIVKNKYKLKSFSFKILSRSIDARDKNNVFYLYKLMIETNEHLKGKDVGEYKAPITSIEYKKWNAERPVVVGFGPAGIFASLYLARCGGRPIILERGGKIEDRRKAVDDFLKTKVLNKNSNVQFGEGGAGAFSDGKLTTNVKNPLINFILYELYLHGAKEDILYDSKPHVGTDYLGVIVKNIREEIISLGGEFYFNHTFTDAKEIGDTIHVEFIDNLTLEKKSITTGDVFLGIGHSSKDTIRHLYNNMNVNMEPKQFSMGVRIEHLREDINRAQYGKFHKYLPAAYYKLAAHNSDNRGVYTFCMCPGGYVMASQSDEESIVVNGMSNNDRGNINSNSALLVDVRVSDYYKGNVLDGIDYQEKYEHKAFSISSDYRAPSNLCREFLNDEVATSERSIKTSYPHGLCFTDLSQCLPDYVIDGLKYGINEFDKKLKGFKNDDAIIIGIESRSSSPVRILRDEDYNSSIKGIHPIGEGAGYAGGITSAALDGLKCAIHVNSKK